MELSKKKGKKIACIDMVVELQKMRETQSIVSTILKKTEPMVKYGAVFKAQYQYIWNIAAYYSGNTIPL